MGSREPRSLKKAKLGIPDVYRQESNQLEDILNETNVQKGFLNSSLVANESASALGDLPLSSLFGQLKSNFEEILTVKQKLNTLQDGGRRKPQKEHFWPVTPKIKEATAQWFHNLATGKFPPSLVKKIPIFHKKEEILDHLCEHSVPLLRAAWFLKMTTTYYSSVSEAKISKKRQTGNAAQEWTMIITRYLKDLIGRLTEYFCSVPSASNSGSANTSSLFPQHQRPHIENAQKQWVYLTRLSWWMYEDNLLNAHMFLTWLVEQWKALKPDDDGLLKLLLPQTFQYLHDIVRCQLLARNLARVCCWKLSYLLKPDDESGDEADGTAAGESENEETTVRLRSSGMAAMKNGSSHPQADYSNCSYHRNMVESLSCIVQSVALRCPTALLWMPSANIESNTLNTGPPSVGGNSGKGEEGTLRGFSPLDQLGYAPSELPLPSRLDQELREQVVCHLQAIEDDICLRGAAAEGLWRSREYDNPHEATMIKFVLKLLEELDRYDYNKATRLGSVEELYEKLFVLEYGSNDVGLAAIELIVPLLCDWAVNAHFGHVCRVYVVARLFRMAQARLQKILSGSRDAADTEGMDDARVPRLMTDQQEDCDDDDGASVASLDCVRFPFRDCLMHYLDTQAPLPGSDDGPLTVDSTFHRLVILFGELIRTGVFSYSHYLSTLISRGDLQASPVQQDTMQSIIDEQKEGFIDSFSLDNRTYGASELSSSLQKLDESTEFSEIQMEGDSERSEGGIYRESFFWGKSLKRLHSSDDLSDAGSNTKRPRRSESYTRIQMENLFGGDLSDSPPDSVKSADSGRASPQSCTKRHFHYALKFPIPEEMCSEYFMKQRLVVLFGVGQDREEAAKELEQVTEEVCQHLTHTEDNTSSASVVYQTSHEDAVKSFVAASQFNRCRVLHACHEKLFPRHGDTSSQRERYESVSVDSVEFLFELMELAGDVVLLLDLVQELLTGEELYESSSDEAEETERLTSGGTGETTGGRRHVAEMYVIGPKLVPSVLGVLWKYNRCVLLSRRTTQTVFEGLFRYVRHVSDSSVCCNTERCVLAYLNHLYTSCSHLQATFRGVFEKLASNIQLNICGNLKPAQTEVKLNAAQISELSKDLRFVKERSLYGELKKSDANLYSFVYRVMVALTREDNRNSAQSLVELCVNAVSQCKGLNAELLGALRAMACPADKKYRYSALLDGVDYRLPAVQEQIAIFTSVLVARQCFSLTDVLAHVVQPSLKSARVHGERSEQGVRLTCMLLQWLLTKPPRSSSVTAPSGGIFNPGQFVKSGTRSAMVTSDERRLLAAREMLDLPTVFTIIRILWRLSTPSGSSRVSSSSLASNMTLTARTLTDLCRQPWMKTLFLKDTDALCSKDMLMDMSLVAAEARYLLKLVCSPDGETSVAHKAEEPPEESASRVVENLNLWTFNMSWLDLQLLIRQHRDDEQQSKRMLDCIAQCVMDIFWTDCKALSSNSNHNIVWQLIGVSVWLVSPLVSKLTPAVQGMLLRAAGRILQRDQWWKPNVERKIDTTNPLAVPWQKPFLALVMASLNSQDQAKTDFLTSIHRQLTQFLAASERERHPLDHNAVVFAQEALRLRLSLVGAMFDTLLRNNTQCGEWCVVLMQLMTSGTVTRTSNYGHLYSIVFDMLSTLLEDGRFLNEQAAVPTSDEPGRKASIPIMKRLKKEVMLCEANQVTEECKTLLPLPQRKIKVPKVEPRQEPGKKTGVCPQGYCITGQQYIDPWDVMEGAKNSGPLSLSLYGAVRVERKPLTKYEQLFQAARYNKIPRPFVSCTVRRVVVTDSSSDGEEDQQASIKTEPKDESLCEISMGVTDSSAPLSSMSTPSSAGNGRDSPLTGRLTPQFASQHKGRLTPSKLIGQGMLTGSGGQVIRQLSDPLHQELQGEPQLSLVPASTSGLPRPKFLSLGDQVGVEELSSLTARSQMLQTRSQPTTPVISKQSMHFEPLPIHQVHTRTGTPIADIVARAALSRPNSNPTSGTPTRSITPVGGFTMKLPVTQQTIVQPIAQRPQQQELQLHHQQQQNAISRRPLQILSSAPQTFLTPSVSFTTSLHTVTPTRTPTTPHVAMVAPQPQQQQQQLALQQGHQQQQLLKSHILQVQQRHQLQQSSVRHIQPHYSSGASNRMSVPQANFISTPTQQQRPQVTAVGTGQPILQHQLIPVSQVVRTQQAPHGFSQVQSVVQPVPQTMVVTRPNQDGSLQTVLSAPSRLSQLQLQQGLQQQQQQQGDTAQQLFLQYQQLPQQQSAVVQYQRQLSGGQGGGTL